jgi:hypothetical protein
MGLSRKGVSVMEPDFQKKTILIGKMEVAVYLLPDKTYRWSMQQASLLAGFNKSWLSDTVADKTKRFEDLKVYGFKELDIQHVPDRFLGIKLIPTQSFMAVIMLAAYEGRPEAIALLIASMQETLERRADHAFGIIKNEREYQLKFDTRYDSIALNINLKTAINDWIDRQTESQFDIYCKKHGIHSRGGVFGKTIGTVYQVLFGKTKSEINEFLGVTDKSSTPRDTIWSLQLQNITQIEILSAKLITSYDDDPINAVLKAAKRLLIEIEEPRLGDRVSLKQAHKKKDKLKLATGAKDRIK